MAIEDIDLGTIPLDGTDGDTAREAFTKVNGNFDDLDTRVTALENEPEPGTVSSVNGILPNSSGNVSLTAADVGAATTAQGLLADSAVQPSSLGTAAYQDANSFALTEDLQNYERILTAGDNIVIDRTDPLNPIISADGGSTITAEQIKELYEANPNTNAFTDADVSKLSDIEDSATENETDAYLLSRGNHTGTQTSSTISDFAASVRSTLLMGLGVGTNAVITATDTLLQALAKLQAQITGKQDNLVSGTNIKTLNGQSLLGAGDVTLGGRLLQVVEGTPFTAFASNTVIIPFDDSVPQNNEGVEYVSATITPLSASSKLIVQCFAPIVAGGSGGTPYLTGAIFRDSASSAISTTSVAPASASWTNSLYCEATTPSNSTQQTTFRFRIGASTSVGVIINGASTGTGMRLGGSSRLTIRIMEVDQ